MFTKARISGELFTALPGLSLKHFGLKKKWNSLPAGGIINKYFLEM